MNATHVSSLLSTSIRLSVCALQFVFHACMHLTIRCFGSLLFRATHLAIV